MSFLNEVHKVSEAHYVLPMIGEMRTEVHAYLSEMLFARTDEALWRQASSGYDISCGVVYMKVPRLSAADVADKRRAWINDVEQRIATGIGSQLCRGQPSHYRAMRAKGAGECLQRDWKGLLRDLAQPGSGRDTRVA